ncbi:MAG: hypothetical protein E6583_03860 [Clostridium sp.]|nr:hypothetical protein [Clostridium sp.]
MTRNEYLAAISKCNIDQHKVVTVEEKYHNELPNIIKEIISFSEDTIIFDDEWRMLSFSEIIEAEQDLHVDFVKMDIIPLVDCGENNFIVYDFEDKMWSKFNIIDECFFKKKAMFNELF